jgi:ferrous-iron efflux pump FieF
MSDKLKYSKKAKPQYALIAGGASLITVVFLISIKLAAYLASGSASVLASLTDSISDSAISVMSFFALRYSLQPADHEHRFGHGKVEGVAAMFQAAFICGAAVFLLFESLFRFTQPHSVHAHMTGVLVMSVSIVASIILVTIQRYSLKHAPSLAVEADKAHYSTDIIMNGGVIGVLLILYYGGPAWVDPVFAVCVAAYLVNTAKDIGLKAADMLLDKELSSELRDEIVQMVKEQPGVLGIHDLRTRKSGMRIFISFDIEADPALSLHDAHEIARASEKRLLADFPDAEIMIHVDPYGDTDDSRHQVKGVHY